MAWKNKEDKPSSVLARIPKSAYDDPKKFDYKKECDAAKEESVIFRIISLADEDITETPMLRCTVRFNNGQIGDIAVPDPGALHNTKIKDDKGNPMFDGKAETLYRVIVWVYSVVDKKGRTLREINELRYIEYGTMVAQQLGKLAEDEEDEGYGFTSCPKYDLRLKVYKEAGFTKYTLRPVKRVTDADGNKVASPNFGVGLKKSLGKERYAIVEAEMDDMIQHIKKLLEDETKPENVKRKFSHYRDEQQDKKGAKSSAPKGRGRADDDEDEDDEDEDTDVEEEEDEDEEEEEKPKKSSKKPAPGRKAKDEDEDEEEEDEEEDADKDVDEDEEEEEEEEPPKKKKKNDDKFAGLAKPGKKKR